MPQPLSYSAKWYPKRRLLPWIVLAIYFASMCQFTRYYAPRCVFEFGEGFIKFYWGGDKAARNDCVFNAGQWPLDPDTHYAGLEWTQNRRWECYGPSILLDPHFFGERIKDRGLATACGVSVPRVLSSNGAASVTIPCGLMPIAAVVFLAFRKIRGITKRWNAPAPYQAF